MNTQNQGNLVIQPWDDDYTGAAIYSLVDENRRRYVGQAVRLQERLQSHRYAFERIRNGSESKITEGRKLVTAIRQGKTFTVEILRKLEGDEATINNLRYWENEYIKKFGGTERTYNVSLPPVPIWNHDPFNAVIVNESPEKTRKRIPGQRNDAYQKENIRRFVIKLNKQTESDREIMEYLSHKSNVQGYIKDLVRADMM